MNDTFKIFEEPQLKAATPNKRAFTVCIMTKLVGEVELGSVLLRSWGMMGLLELKRIGGGSVPSGGACSHRCHEHLKITQIM